MINQQQQNCPQSESQGRRTPIDFSIVLDGTISMGFAISAVIQALMNMLTIMFQGNLDPCVGMVVFRDERLGERPQLYPISDSPEPIMKALKQTVAAGGGDVPESSLPALMHALSLPGYRSGVEKVFLHITDAACHDPEGDLSSKNVLDALMRENVLYFACAPEEEQYRMFANATGGLLFPITGQLDPDAFTRILYQLAHVTVQTVLRSEDSVSADVLDALRRTKVDM